MSGRDHSCEGSGRGGMNDDGQRECSTTTYCHTLEDAIAEAMRDAQDGDEVAVHSAQCAGAVDGAGCTCEPEVYVVRRAVA